MRRPLPAPTERRTAISFWRAAAWASKRFATFRQAMSNTSPTTVMSTQSGRKKPNQECVNQAEDCSIGADAKRQRGNGDRSETAILQQSTKSVSNVLAHCFKPNQYIGFSRAFQRPHPATKPARGVMTSL